MKRDEEGFLYPVVDNKTCIDCSLCEKVCPELNVKDACEENWNTPKIFASYAVWYHNGAKDTLERWFGYEIWTD